MREWIIKKLGGFTLKEMELVQFEKQMCIELCEMKQNTINELSMIQEERHPPKKRGRPRKALKTYPVLGNPTVADSETGETREIRKNPDGSLAVKYVGKKRKG